MDNDTFTLNNQFYSNNNNILLGIINELHQIANSSHENLTIKRISDVIIKMNFIINENKKNTELIINHISLLENKMNNKFAQLNINSFNNNQLNNQVINYPDGSRYVGQIINGLREGKGTYYLNDGDRYEGEWRNAKREGKGIMYNNNGDRYEGDYRNAKREGKGIYYHKNGDRYEGDYRNDYAEGSGAFYYSNGDRTIGNYHNNVPIGKHAMLTSIGEVKSINY